MNQTEDGSLESLHDKPSLERPRPFDEDQEALRYALSHPGSALCTIVGIEGTFSRRIGAQLAVAASGETAGSLADGCLEKELANRVTSGIITAPTVFRFGAGSPYIDFRLPCGSGVDILVDPKPSYEHLKNAVVQLDKRAAASLSLALAEKNGFPERKYIPCLRIMIFGSGPEIDALAEMAEIFGAQVSCIRPGEGIALGKEPAINDVDDWTAIILLFHDHEWEQSILTWAVRTPAFYIGAIGGRRTRERRRSGLEDAGITKAQIDRVRSPIGLIPHTRDVRVLAISILAELVAEYECLRPCPA